MKVTVKNVLRKKHSSATDGIIFLRVGLSGYKVPELKSYGYNIPAKFWNADDEVVKSSHPNATFINAEITRTKENYRRLFSDQARTWTREDIKRLLSNEESNSGSFIQFYADYLKANEKRWSSGYYQHQLTEFNYIKKTHGPSITFSDINVEFLEKHEASLTCAKTTLNTKMKRLQEVITKAIKRGHILPKSIDGYRWPLYKEPETHYLTLAQCELISGKLFKGDYNTDEPLRAVVAYFLVECYAGIRFSDWSRFEIEKLLDKESLKVRTQKTGAPIYLPLNKFKRLKEVIEYIRSNGIKFTYTEQATNRILKYSVGNDLRLKFPLTTHVGRHTCGTLLGEMGFSTRAIGEVLGITEVTAKRYIKHTRKGLENEFAKYGGL